MLNKKRTWPSCSRVIVFLVLVVIVTRLILWISFPDPPPLPPSFRYFVAPSESVWSRELISLKSNWSLDPSYLKHYNSTQLFRWLKKSDLWSFYLQSAKKEAKGVVMPVGSKYVNNSITAIYGIRTLGSSLPIEIWHFRGELSIDDLKLFAEIPNLQVKCIDDAVDASILKLSGYAIKPFSILASEFSEVILVDADVIFLQNPDLLFQDTLYRSSGTLFFKDRTLPTDAATNGRVMQLWLTDLFPVVSQRVQEMRIWNNISRHEMEAGVVVLDKGAHFFGLLAICGLNNEEREMGTYRKVYGDKETYWIGLELMQEDYSFNNNYPGGIGLRNKFRVCGNLMHVGGWNGRPYWFNSGLYADKDIANGYQKFTHWAVEEGKSEDWIEHTRYTKCIVKHKGTEVYPIPPETLSFLERLRMYDYSRV